jgi:DMSO/TMAO reductase YedYZ molybdopterin-dependent catalytic subunit
VFVDPLERLLVRHLDSRQRYQPRDVSPFFRVNGHPPVGDDYRRLADRGFHDYRLAVGGLVARPLVLSLDELRALGATTQTTMHNCIQGWTAVAEWAGVPLAALLERCGPLPQARYLVFHAFDDKAETEGEPFSGCYYGTLPIDLARHPQTILALEMNGKPLAIEHGSPIRLRVETQLGFKHVKWIRAIDFVEDYRMVGQGEGGWREDQQHYTTFAGI